MTTNERIEKYVEDLHKELGIKEIPVPLEKIAEDLNIRIKKAPSDKFSGLLLRKDGRALIGINEDESYVRQRFTIAHEFGHFFLHETKDAFVDYRDNKSGIARSPKEREANMFAAAFLIPRNNLVNDVKKLIAEGIFETEVENLAKKYAVSKESMSYRILNLGLSTKI